ncbi:coagulation factor IX-like [Amphibalanus amphitrite]|uniref:coagulation factor IX-like n=1 Tax=Amphibalanus amphitrite TaxID=1232801 RepID=UPI001C912FBE|nr:coagulation factor IX-like [Amphibalanus amphitrite]
MLRLQIACCCLLAAAALAKPQAKPARKEPKPVDFDDNAATGVPYNGNDVMSDSAEPLPMFETSNGFTRAVHDITLNPNHYYWISENYPNNYTNNIDVGLRLRGSDGQEISISCDPFKLEYHPSCDWDYLSINGQKFCGTRTVPSIKGTLLTIDFHTDYSVTDKGFYCRIVVPEPGTQTTPSPSTDCQCGVRQTRVVGGTDATAGQFPWQAGIVSTGNTRSWCGGSVINNRYVLTAAHCTDGKDASQIQVMLGDLRIGTTDAGEQRYSVVQIIEHPQYTSASGSGWDFSLLKLDREITFSSTISPVCLAEAGQTYADVTAIASGYGRVGAEEPQATTLQHVQLPVWSQSRCQGNWGTTLKSNMICAGGYPEGGRSVCMGDSGGPLVTEVSGRFRLIGVVSFGRPCALANSPDVFARVTEALTWIQSNTADAQYCTA